MSIKTVSLYVFIILLLGCSSIHKSYKSKNDVSKKEFDSTNYNYNLDYQGKGSINYRGELALFIFTWINREKVISIVLNDSFKLNEVLIILDKKNVSVELKKITSSNLPIVLDSFKDNMLAKKILREALLWINRSIDFKVANGTGDYFCSKTVKKLYWQGRIDGCGSTIKKINLEGKDLKLKMIFRRMNGENR